LLGLVHALFTTIPEARAAIVGRLTLDKAAAAKRRTLDDLCRRVRKAVWPTKSMWKGDPDIASIQHQLGPPSGLRNDFNRPARRRFAQLSDRQMKGTLSPMLLPASARLILASLISIGLQLCCCNIQGLLGSRCESGRATPNPHTDCHRSDVHSDVDSHAHNDSTDPSRRDQSAPSGPCHPDNDGCACGTHDKAPSHIDKLDLPVIVVAILPLPVVLDRASSLCAPRYAALHGLSPSRTTLLQQHCALIV